MSKHPTWLADDGGTGEQFHQLDHRRPTGARRPAGRGSELPESAVAESLQDLLPGTTITGPTVARSQLLSRFPSLPGVTITDTNVGAWYNSLQVSVQKSYSHGLTFAANYTLSKNIQAPAM